MSRIETAAGKLARLGFEDAEAATRCIERLAQAAAAGAFPADGAAVPAAAADWSASFDALAASIAQAADPDQAVRYLADLSERLAVSEPVASADLVAELLAGSDLAARVVAVVGASAALAEHLLRHPDHVADLRSPELSHTRPTAASLRAEMLAAVGAAEAAGSAGAAGGAAEPVATLPEPLAADALRVTYRRMLLRLAARDLTGLDVSDVAAELSDCAAATLEGALAIARASLGPAAASCRIAVIAMGKCGGHELNYASDVDVVFVAEPAPGCDEGKSMRAATRLASALMRLCSDHTAEGTIWPVDAALRPEGKAGQLVRTLSGHVSYYRRWAKTWEFQALLKARPAAGDRALGQEYVDAISPMVWSAVAREGFVLDVQAMRRRVLETLPAADAERQIKLGAGGLRDVEFAVQLLQLVHGRMDPAIRSSTTLSALAELTAGGYIGRDDGAALDAAYRFLRTLEHRMQLLHLRRTHVVPAEERALRALARSMGYRTSPLDELSDQWRDHRLEVRRLHEKLFYRPLLTAVANLPADEVRLSPEAAGQRLAALGFRDPVAALRHIEALTTGVSRAAAIQRTLLPVMLEWFAVAPDPDAGLLNFRRISDALGATHWYLRLLRDEGQVAQRMARVLASSRFASDLLQQAPDGVALLGEENGLVPRDEATLRAEMVAAAGRHDDPVAAVSRVRGVRRRELLRISAADLSGEIDVSEVGCALGDLTIATLEAALVVACSEWEDANAAELPVNLAIVAMGRLGGREVGYGSDADVLFVSEARDGVGSQEASAAAQQLAHDVRRLLAAPGPDPALLVDADLRPEGKQGPLVRTLDSYAAYYARWSHVWEAQALLRASADVGDPGLCSAFTELIDPLRYPRGGLSTADVKEIRRIKARVDAERLPRGADPALHLKLGRGGLGDVEWTIQLLQMQYAATVPGLRSPRTLNALDAAAEADLITAVDAAALRSAWAAASRLRNAVTQVRGRPSDSLPHNPRERAAVAHVYGYAPGESDAMVNDYLRLTRRSRSVVERVFWG